MKIASEFLSGLPNIINPADRCHVRNGYKNISKQIVISSYANTLHWSAKVMLVLTAIISAAAYMIY